MLGEDCAGLKGHAPVLPLPHSSIGLPGLPGEGILLIKSWKSDVRGRVGLLLAPRSALRTRRHSSRCIDIMHVIIMR